MALGATAGAPAGTPPDRRRQWVVLGGLVLTLGGLVLISGGLPAAAGPLGRSLPLVAAGLLGVWIGGLLLGSAAPRRRRRRAADPPAVNDDRPVAPAFK